METNPCPQLAKFGSPFGLLLRPKSFIHKYFSSTDYISRWNLTTRTWKISFHIVHGSHFLPPAYMVSGKVIFSVMAVCLFTGGPDVMVVVAILVRMTLLAKIELIQLPINGQIDPNCHNNI